MSLSVTLACLVAVVALSVAYFHLSSLSEQELIDRVKGKRVVVTGASLGIGRELVKEYARLGASDIVLVARSEDKLNHLRDEVNAQQDTVSRIHVVPADLSSEETCQGVVDKAEELMGGMDYLVLNHITNSQYGLWTGKYWYVFIQI